MTNLRTPSSTLPSQPLPNSKGSINAISFHEDSLEHEVTDDDEEEFLKMLEEISMKDDVGFEESERIIKLGDGKQEDMPIVTNLSIPPSNDLVISLPSMEDTVDSIPEKLSDLGPCLVNYKVGDEDLDGCMCDPGESCPLLPFLKTARFKLDAFEGTFSFESNGICATFTMDDSIEEKLVEHSILWCDLNKTIVVSTLEAKPEKLIEGKAFQDSVLNTTSPMSTHPKDNALLSSEGLRYVPPPLRQATKRGRNSPWMRDKKGKKDKGKLDEPGKKNSMKTNGVAENVSYMEWNHSTNLSVLKGEPLEFRHDHSHNKGVDAYLVKDTSKWK
ncbi:hypothetical protein PIB30_094094 [Stylosanthes scabra]|uniref:Uncharacterized protein n=1 Tax=Stylosanthes scabra TaxID=79078 RepID=A0ABU6VV74_9FABA|nr:hypothetical protein [Stylosanthes scabra]